MKICDALFRSVKLSTILISEKSIVTMVIREVTSIKPPTPDQQRIKALQAQAKRAREAVKAERARQKIASGQKVLNKL
jgi:hypothetical protein